MKVNVRMRAERDTLPGKGQEITLLLFPNAIVVCYGFSIRGVIKL